MAATVILRSTGGGLRNDLHARMRGPVLSGVRRESAGLDAYTNTDYRCGMATKKPERKHPAAVALSRLAVAARRKKISPERRSELASHAVRARWAKAKPAKANLKGGRPMKWDRSGES
jgi:hypothetical protein